MSARQTLKARKALRSQSAKRGWETRRASTLTLAGPSCQTFQCRTLQAPDPNPWPVYASKVKAGWSRVLEFLRS